MLTWSLIVKAGFFLYDLCVVLDFYCSLVNFVNNLVSWFEAKVKCVRTYKFNNLLTVCLTLLRWDCVYTVINEMMLILIPLALERSVMMLGEGMREAIGRFIFLLFSRIL